ncbi:MAG: winged helix-turn-helix transcriptional regulator [Candidatus Thorarchaeota archaeon]
MDKLVDSKAIHSFVVRLSLEMTNMEYAFAIIEFDSPPDDTNLLDILRDSPSITQVSKTFDGRYTVFAVFFSTDELSDLTTLLWSLKDLNDVNLYPKFKSHRGGKIELIGVHMRILRCLLEDARMSIADIAECTRLTARRVTKAVNQMRESEAITFTIRLTENVAT